MAAAATLEKGSIINSSRGMITLSPHEGLDHDVADHQSAHDSDMRSHLGSRPPTAATGLSDSPYHSSSDRSFAYSVISSKFQSTGEVLLLPKVNARKSIKFDKEMTGPKIMAVRETAQWLISNNNRMTDDLSRECRRLDESYLKWYRKHFNDKKDVLERVSNLLNHAKQESTERALSKSPARTVKSTSTRSTTRHHMYPAAAARDRRAGFFPTELPDVENVYRDTTVDDVKPVAVGAEDKELVQEEEITKKVTTKETRDSDQAEETDVRRIIRSGKTPTLSREAGKVNSRGLKEVRIVSPL